MRSSSLPFACARCAGFSLLELAISLVVLGLIVGAILFGQSLVHTSALQQAATEVQEYQAKILQFEQRFLSLPGDMPDASNYFGGVNGNGDRRIAHANGADAEEFIGWQHLQLAGYLDQQFSGGLVSLAHSLGSAAGSTVPPSQLSGGYRLFFYNDAGPNMFYTGLAITNEHLLAFANLNSVGYLEAPVLNGDDALALESKLDDGTPDGGNILASQGSDAANSCFIGSSYTAGSSIACVMYFRMPSL